MLERGAQPGQVGLGQIHRRRSLKDHRLRSVDPVGEERWQRVDVVAADQLRRIGAECVDRPPQPLEARGLVGPDERL